MGNGMKVQVYFSAKKKNGKFMRCVLMIHSLNGLLEDTTNHFILWNQETSGAFPRWCHSIPAFHCSFSSSAGVSISKYFITICKQLSKPKIIIFLG